MMFPLTFPELWLQLLSALTPEASEETVLLGVSQTRGTSHLPAQQDALTFLNYEMGYWLPSLKAQV